MKKPVLKEMIVLAVLFVVYFFTGKMGLSLAFFNASASPVWPPSGIALVAMLLFGYRVWPAILFGAFFVNITTAGNAATGLAIASGNTLEALAGAYLVNRFSSGRSVFEQPQDIVKFALMAGLGCTMISATFGVGALALGGFVSAADVPMAWLTWWFGDMTGIFTVAPFVLLWSEKSRLHWGAKKFIEAALLAITMTLVALTVFSGFLPMLAKDYPLEFLCVPFLLWAAFRFGQREAITITLLLFGIAASGTLHGIGPFARHTANESLLLLQMFIGFCAMVSLIVAAAVTQRRIAEETLMYLASIVENSEEAIIGKTLGEVITSWNAGAARIYGYTAVEVVGRPITMLTPQDRGGEMAEIMKRLLKGDRITQYETKRVCKDGRQIDVSLTISPIFDRTGRIVGASTIAQNISDRKDLEKQREKQSTALAESLNELARRERIMRSLLEDIQGSKTKLEEQKRTLQDANKRLETLSALKDEFVATVSHELRTPLTAIKEGVSLLIDKLLGPLNEEQMDFLTTVDQNIDRLTELIHNMLDLSKIEAGRLRMMRRPMDVAELLRETVQNYKTMAGERDLRFEIAAAPPAFADLLRITQVVGNLFSNAMKFTADNGVIVLGVKEAKDGFVSVFVKDNGIGIAQEDIPKLFKKFSQVGERRATGTGLGLALCKELVELHGGTVQLVSEKGKGSTFSFTLPIYTPKLALQEYFKEQKQWAEQSKQEKVGVLVLDAAPFMQTQLVKQRHNGHMDPLEMAEVFVRKHLHESDIVCWPETDRLTVLTVYNVQTLPQTLSRLAMAVNERMAAAVDQKMPAVLKAGFAVYPEEGADIHELYRQAVSRMSALELAAEYPHKP